MSLPRVRFTVRRMMVSVAIVAVAIQAWQLSMWSLTYRWSAQQASSSEKEFRQAIAEGRDVYFGCFPDPPRQPPPTPARVAKLREWASYYTLLKRKYQFAATHPWISPVGRPPSPKP